MKTKIPFSALLISPVMVSCVPISVPAPTISPPLTATLTSTSIPATLTPQPTRAATQVHIPTSTPFVNENASEDCFLSIDFIPGKTGIKQVIAAWGNPASRSSFGPDHEYWHFDTLGAPYVVFKRHVVDTVRFSLRNCSLANIIAKLGPPEKVEVTVLISCSTRIHLA